MEKEKKYYIPAGKEKIYVDKELFDEFNKMRSSQAYYNNRYRDNTCELKEEAIAEHVDGVEEEILKKYMLKQLYKSIKALSCEQRQVIYLIFFENMSERKAAKKLGIKQYQVHRIKERALKNIKDKIIF